VWLRLQDCLTCNHRTLIARCLAGPGYAVQGLWLDLKPEVLDPTPDLIAMEAQSLRAAS
jgi:hypothetical protein